MTRKHPLAECEVCPLQNARCAPTHGPQDAKVVIVSRSPGKADVLNGKPMSSTSGKILQSLLVDNGYDRKQVKVTNVVLCRCDEVPGAAIECCRPRLEADLESAETIIAAGREAAGVIASKPNISAARGMVHKRTFSNRTDQRVIITNNPAVVIHESRSYPNLVKDFKLALNPLKQVPLPDVHWTNDVEKGLRWIRDISRLSHSTLSCDIESRGLTPDSPIVAFGVSADGTKALSFGERVCNDRTFFREHLRSYLENPQVDYLWHNGKFDCKVLRFWGIAARVDDDSILASYAADERPGTHALEFLARQELGWPDYEPEIVKYFKSHADDKNPDGSWRVPVPDELYPYNAIDTAAARLIFPILLEKCIRDGVEGVYRNILLRASPVVMRMESAGILYHIARAVDILEEEVWPNLRKIRRDMQVLLENDKYNPNSSVVNQKLVNDEWKVIHQMQGRKDKERSVDKAAYKELQAGRFQLLNTDPGHIGFRPPDDPLYETVKQFGVWLGDFKTLDKQRSNYLEGLVEVAEKRKEGNGTGRIFASFNIIGTVSGRFSGDSPNLQNITRPKPGLPDIRSLFVPSPGCKLISADYSQAELRTLAVVTGDPTFTKAYEEGLDIHAIAAERFYGPNWTKENRSNAKNMNFGVAYQQSADTFLEKHGIPKDEAQAFIDWWWSEFAAVRTWVNHMKKLINSEQVVVTPFGRKRRFDLITKENQGDVEREGINFYIQSTAHDFTLWSLCELDEKIDWDTQKFVIEGHDSIVGDVREDRILETAHMMVDVMESAPSKTLGWTLPFRVEVTTGPNWSEQTELELAA